MSAQQSVQQLPDGEFTHVAISLLSFSKSAAQAERRKHFDPKQLEELVGDIKVKGILQPIVVRPITDKGGSDAFEVVAGERRTIGAELAGLTTIPAMVRKLTDDQALDVQLVENLQREGLHELVECEGFEDLKTRGFTVEQIAEKVGRSVSYVYKRLELAACGQDVRKAFYEGKVDASKSLLLSRLKGDDQKKALKEILTQWGEPMSFRDALRWINDHYLLRLDNAPFAPDDEKLVPAAGACGKCPKNTASQKDLFGNVSKESGRCTDSKCFQEKTVAASAIKVKAAQDAKRPVLQGKEAKKALGKHGDGAGNFIVPGRMVEGDQQYRTYEKVLGKDLAKVTTVAVDPETKKVVELVDKAEAKKLISEKGIKLTARAAPTRSAPKESEKQKADRLKREAEQTLLVNVAKAIHAKAPKPLTQDELGKLAEMLYNNTFGGDISDQILGTTTAPRVDKLNEAGLVRMIRSIFLAEHIEDGDKNVVFDAAKRHGVDVKKIEAELAPKAPAAAAPPKSKKAAKKK